MASDQKHGLEGSDSPESVAAADERNAFGFPIGLQRVPQSKSSTVDNPPENDCPLHGNRGDQMPPSDDGDDFEIEHDEGGGEG